ncbi:sensor histidine kinase [Marinomonas sp. IMCC 4694]|uniref:sensor histidine kinase n=1 Tax=Marinomonas sp. IMCC 4694 TaxID=2605432 RepID=UPI0011E7AC68|nr:HAMP domain-containing sensor histidine kinase [Marinomonas sp. IMCC 4694]TYL47621.1 HAMP domain-containing histidine kinase [Marinomonas sp. IMCC 4694]
MKQPKTAKQLTFTYFSIVAFAIIVFHFSMFESLVEDIELIYAKNRMFKDKDVAMTLLEGTDLKHVVVPPFTNVYVGIGSVPEGVVFASNIAADRPYELDKRSTMDLETFSMRFDVVLNGQKKDLYLLHYDDVYELSEEQIFQTQTTQLALSLLLLVISLWVVMRISNRLTKPLSQLSQRLHAHNSDTLSAISLPEGSVTREILHLVDRLNHYQDQIRELVKRERAFNRYASHELRTPLMVIKGAATLLAKSDSKVFLERQRVRIAQACQEMEDYISTLLSLTREEDLGALTYRAVGQEELGAIRQAHLGYVIGPEVQVDIVHEGVVMTRLPVAALHILVGNVLKNALACTDQGKVTIKLSNNTLSVIDTGCGLKGKPGGDSYGLGLMIVRDLCSKYHCSFTLTDNLMSKEGRHGCTAKVVFPVSDTPN